MTERSNQTYSSRIAERPSLRIRRTKVNDERGDYGPGDDGGKGVTRAWSGDGGREAGVVDEGYHTYVRPCKSPVYRRSLCRGGCVTVLPRVLYVTVRD